MVPTGSDPRRLAFRTSYEIEQERQALKALRGDFENVATSVDRAAEALRATIRPRE